MHSQAGPAVTNFVPSLPKVELHVHLEGTLRPETFVELARKYAVPLPAGTASELRQVLSTVQGSSFFGAYSAMGMCLNAAEDFERVTYEYGAEMARQNIRYAEVHINLAFHRARGVDSDVCFAGANLGRDRAHEDFGVEVSWIVGVMRAPRLDSASRMRAAEFSLAAAIEGRDHGVVALGLGGEEVEGDVATFAPLFERAKAGGLHVVPHAGELAGPANVAAAVDLLGAERIAHGVRAVEDAELVRRLANAGVCLDVCLTSNVRLNVFPDMQRHPMRALMDQGVALTLSTDDPGVLGVDLNHELDAAMNALSLRPTDIERLQLQAIHSSFLSPGRKEVLAAELSAESQRIRVRQSMP
ncbi:MAG TPA: adenosine deaminase [Candidatus Dormibacteraeota bacterium]|nr:adenosine deaminase [Candidatus Dormibacteraeota bacterium]